jgi:hypothetical protein
LKYSEAGKYDRFCRIQEISTRGCTITWHNNWTTSTPSGTASQATFSGAVNYSRILGPNGTKNIKGLTYYYNGVVSSNDNTGNFAGPTTNTTYSSILRL